MTVTCQREAELSVEDYVRVIGDTAMRSKRPLANRARIAAMLSGTNLFVTARDEAGEILGLARCLTDFAWICYCAELAVRENAQGLGIGKALLAATRDLLGPRVSITLVAEPDAVAFYERVGMERVPAAFVIQRTDRT